MMKTLKELSHKASVLRGVEYVLGWDQETYMPPGAAEARAEQIKLIASLIHQTKTSKEYKRALSSLIDLKTGGFLSKGLSKADQAALREWRRDYLKDSKLPTSFVEEFSKLTSIAQEVWKKARKENAFHIFAPYLEKIVQMARKKADLLGYRDHPYDALLDLYEPELTTKLVEKTFDEVQRSIVPLIQKAPKLKSQYKKKMGVSEQLALSRVLLEKMGYDFNHGRIDLSTHPFSTAPHPTDSRITTRIHENDPLSNILTTMHEAGHALYEMGLPHNQWGTPLGEYASMAVHESQSRFWETRIGLSRPFWELMAPEFKAPAELLFRDVNLITPSFIRVEADEATYPLHVILRFRLEKKLIEGSLKVKDLPDIWREQMQSLLGITPPSDTLGCLQDIHWSMGAFGYFPTYLLGTLYASHLFEAFAKKHPDWESRVRKGELTFITAWLKNSVHRHGRTYPPLQLIERAAGKPFSPKAFLTYLHTKYPTK